MIIDAKAIIFTLVLVVVACYLGLKFVRAFALQIARENHDAILAMDHAEEANRRKKERAAEAAEESAFAKVQPILTNPASAPPSGNAPAASV